MKQLLIILSLFCLLFAQQADKMLHPDVRDSLLEEYDQFFPILGRQVLERGFALPNPAGVNLLFMRVVQPVAIDGIKLGTNNIPMQEVTFLEFPNTISTVNTLNARFDLWVLPFLNIYGMVGNGWTNTSVDISINGTDSLDFNSTVDQTGFYWGGGLTGAIAIKKNFLSVDANWAWTKLDKMDEPVRAGITGIRVGRNFRFENDRSFALWGGTMNQRLKSETLGSIGLAEALPPEIGDKLTSREYQNELWYKVLPQDQKDIVDDFVTEIDERYNSAVVNYSLEKSLERPWSMLLGCSYDINKNWGARMEANFIGRFSIMGNIYFRFKI